jgi:hypothetical protein
MQPRPGRAARPDTVTCAEGNDFRPARFMCETMLEASNLDRYFCQANFSLCGPDRRKIRLFVGIIAASENRKKNNAKDKNITGYMNILGYRF